MKIRLLVDGEEFRDALAEDLASARDSVRLQTLCLEGDDAGTDLARRLIASPAPDKRVLVDSFSRWVVSDRFLPLHPFDRDLRREVAETRRLIAGLRAAGVPVRYTNPVGLLLSRFPGRNHKKLIVVDDRVAYVGGINFCDHNFAWHDVMLRIEDRGAAGFLRRDLEATWSGVHRVASHRSPGLDLFVLDGRQNPVQLQPVVDLVQAARHSILVENPYVTPPFTGLLKEARHRGLSVTVITPRANNLPFVHRHLLWQAAEAGFDVRLYEGRMSHMKAMLVDDRSVILGSANFDAWSYWLQQELVAVVTDVELIAEFRRRVVAPDLARSTPCDEPVTPLLGRIADLAVCAEERFARWLSSRRARARRTQPGYAQR